MDKVEGARRSDVLSLGRVGPREQGRLKVLNAAADAFLEHGIEAATIDDIGELMGATKGRVYHYYRSKSAILLDIHLTVIEMALNEIEPVANGPGSPTERFREMVFRNVSLNGRERSMFYVATAGMLNGLPPSLRAPERRAADEIVRLRTKFEDMFVRVIKEGIATGEFRKVDSRVAAKTCLGAIQWTVVWINPSRGPINRIATEMSSLILSSLVV